MPEAIESFNQVNLGETGVGKTHHNIQTIKLALKAIPETGKQAMKVLVLDFQREEGYAKIKTLPGTREAIVKFVNQKTIEARRITKFHESGRLLNSKEKCDIMQFAASTFKHGQIYYDDIDAYAAFASSGDEDMIGSLMGNRHKGIDNIFSHQAWRKIGVTEAENLTIIRLHKTGDDPYAMDTRKQKNFPMHLCMIGHYIVEDQYDLVNKMYRNDQLTKEQWLSHKSFHVYIDVRKKLIYPVSEGNFKIAVRKYCFLNPKIVASEIKLMIYDNIIAPSAKNKIESERLAMKRLEDKFVEEYLRKPKIQTKK